MASLALAAAPARADANGVPNDWLNSYLFQGSGVENPIIRVGFDPQPEPPALTQLVSHPPDPGIQITNQGDFPSGQNFGLVFGISSASGPLSFGAAAGSPGAPSAQTLNFDIFNAASAALFHVSMSLSTTGGGSPSSWVSFNPQPEPPALGALALDFGATFGFDVFSDATLVLQMRDAQNALISFSQVPEPPALALLLAAGLAGLAGSAWRRGRRRTRRSR